MRENRDRRGAEIVMLASTMHAGAGAPFRPSPRAIATRSMHRRGTRYDPRLGVGQLSAAWERRSTKRWLTLRPAVAPNLMDSSLPCMSERRNRRETQQFDALIKRLGMTRLTRADALCQLGVGALSVLVGASLSEAPAMARRQHSKRGASRLHAQKADAGKVTVCHFTGSEKHPYNVITVSQNALAAHQRHGDFTIDPDDPLHCCLDTDCADTPPRAPPQTS